GAGGRRRARRGGRVGIALQVALPGHHRRVAPKLDEGHPGGSARLAVAHPEVVGRLPRGIGARRGPEQQRKIQVRVARRVDGQRLQRAD
nr:hypothetical protein [Tanacetum cinerariifolium]